MESREFQTVIKTLSGAESSIHRASILEDQIDQLTREQAEELVARFGSTTLISLPRRERDFFAWLREADPTVWQDLWGDDPDESYLVSIAFLPELLPKRRGFLICDLERQQNFFFTDQSITPEEGQLFLESALDIVHENGQLTMEQAFVIEAWRAPIDQWRFAYNYGLPLDQVKRMVLWMISEGILLLPPSEEEAPNGPESNGGSA